MMELMSSLLNDLIEKRKRFTPVKIRFGTDFFRLQYDQNDLRETRVKKVRDSLVRVLGERIFERLLQTTPEQKREMAEEAIEVERDPCAAEYSGKASSKFAVWMPERLPQPFPHMIQWIIKLTYQEELHTGIRFFLEDLVHEEDDWSRSRPYIGGSLESLRDLAPSSVGTATPRDVRNWMNAAASRSSVARLGNLSDANWLSLLSHLDDHLYSQPRGLQPSPGPDIPQLAVLIADWVVGRFALQEFADRLAALFDDMQQCRKAWTESAIRGGPETFWIEGELIDQFQCVTPDSAHTWLRHQSSGVDQLYSISNEQRFRLARYLLTEKRDELDPPQGKSVPYIPHSEPTAGEVPIALVRIARWASANLSADPDARYARIRDRAHAIWERQGRPEGKALEHWVQAQAEEERLRR
jgi:hypothetical protein